VHCGGLFDDPVTRPLDPAGSRHRGTKHSAERMSAPGLRILHESNTSTSAGRSSGGLLEVGYANSAASATKF